MPLRKSMLFLIVLFYTSVAAANVATLNETDYVLTYLPTGDTIVIGKDLSFTPENAQVNLEHYYPTGKNYVADITVYSKDYVTNRGVSVGAPIEKVKECYGEPNRPSGTKSHYKWLSYIDKQQGLKVHFYLDKETDQIIAINLNIYPVGKPPMIKLADGEYH